jgi:hypothetical protein
MKGFKKDGKFRPTGRKKHALTKSDLEKPPKNSMSKNEFVDDLHKEQFMDSLHKAKIVNDEKDEINRKTTKYELENNLPRGSLGSFSNKEDKELQKIIDEHRNNRSKQTLEKRERPTGKRPYFVSLHGYQFDKGDKVQMDVLGGKITDYDLGTIVGRPDEAWYESKMWTPDNKHFIVRNDKTGEEKVYNNMVLEPDIPMDYSNELHHSMSVEKFKELMKSEGREVN